MGKRKNRRKKAERGRVANILLKLTGPRPAVHVTVGWEYSVSSTRLERRPCEILEYTPHGVHIRYTHSSGYWGEAFVRRSELEEL